MIKTKLSMEQIIAGALLLNFDNVSSVDISLLAEDFLKKILIIVLMQKKLVI